jgi:hypothetical protein
MWIAGWAWSTGVASCSSGGTANHGLTDPVPVGVTSVDNLADFAPAIKNPVPRLDNLVDFAPTLKNPVPRLDNPTDSAPVVKNPADSFFFFAPADLPEGFFFFF